MKKVGLITLYNNNYGSILQCFSTKSFIDSLGYDCIVLDQNLTHKNVVRKILKGVNVVKKTIESPQYWKIRKEMTASMIQEEKLLDEEAKFKMRLFVEKNLQPKYYSWQGLKSLNKNKDYIAFISGSDQVWNVSRDINELFFLQFADNSKRIALSASFGTSSIPQYNMLAVKRRLSKYSAISVREEGGVDLIRSLMGITVERLADPVVLFTKDEWKSLIASNTKYKYNYILAHFLNRPCAAAIESLERIASNEKCKVICFSYYYCDYDNHSDWLFVTGDPCEYLALIDNAKYVLTDSFHTTMFSIIFETPFFTFSRQYLHNFSQESRVYSLLKRYNLEDRFITEYKEINNCSKLMPERYSQILYDERLMIKRYIILELQKRNGI